MGNARLITYLISHTVDGISMLARSLPSGNDPIHRLPDHADWEISFNAYLSTKQLIEARLTNVFGVLDHFEWVIFWPGS